MGKRNWSSIKGNRIIFGLTILALAIGFTGICVGCGESYETNRSLDTSEDVVLVVAGSDEDFKAMESLSKRFSEIYPNCEVQYEYIQNYSENLESRIYSDDDRVDMFLTLNIQSGSPNLAFALDLMSQSELDLSDTYPGLINNFVYPGSDPQELYSIPIGAEMRGLFVNITLLKSLGINVPTNQEEFLQACETLSEAGYIPIQGNPSSAGQQLIFPYVVKMISKAENPDKVRQMINNCEPGVSEVFREPLQFLYSLEENNYYNYKYIETEYGAFVNGDSSSSANEFLNVQETEEGFVKRDDIGRVAFMPGASTQVTLMNKKKEDYHSEIEYCFIPAPVTPEGGCTYLSPAKGIAVNMNSTKREWCIEFLNFMFSEKQNKQFTKEYNIFPNTSDLIEYTAKEVGTDKDSIWQPADVTFDYAFYSLIVKSITEIAKSNNPKYMKDNGDGTTTMYDFDYYMDGLELRFVEQRNGDAEQK